MMSKAISGLLRKPSTGEIIATSANQIVPQNSARTYINVVLYSLDPPFLLHAVLKGGLGMRLSLIMHTCMYQK